LTLGEILFGVWSRHASEQYQAEQHDWKDLPSKTRERWELMAKEFMNEAVGLEFK
jgi:hypothetical protein